MYDELTAPLLVDADTPAPSSPAVTTSRPPIGRSALLALLPVGLLAVRGWQQRWLSDDGIIGVRVADQLLHGHGLVFNVGERVETSTTPLWIMLVAATRFVRLADLETAMVGLGLISTTAGLLLACWGATLLWRGEGRRPAFLLPVGAVVLAVLPPMWDFTTSGLETGLSFLWLGACFRLLAGMADTPTQGWKQPALAGVAAGLGPLIRPDFAVISAVFLLVILIIAGKVATPRATVRRMAGLLAVSLAAPVVYQVLRMGFYATLVPTTALAKEASHAWWSQGLIYLGDLVGTYWLLLPLAAVAVLLAAGARDWGQSGARARLLVAAAAVGGGLVHGLFVVRGGGDFMHARFLLPSLFALLLPVAVVEVRGFVRWGAVAAVLPWAAVCATQLRIDYLRNSDGIADERGFYSRAAQQHNPVHTSDYEEYLLYADGREAHRLSQDGRPLLGWRAPASELVYTSVPMRSDRPLKTSYITGNIGITGVRAGRDVHIIDPTGLADPLAARVRLAERGRPGHEKNLGFAWVLARFADPNAFSEGTTQQVYGATIHVSAEALAAARRALGCGAARDIDAAVTEPLTPGRFLRNIGLAIRLNSFRLDPDPIVAETKLCRG